MSWVEFKTYANHSCMNVYDRSFIRLIDSLNCLPLQVYHCFGLILASEEFSFNFYFGLISLVRCCKILNVNYFLFPIAVTCKLSTWPSSCVSHSE